MNGKKKNKSKLRIIFYTSFVIIVFIIGYYITTWLMVNLDDYRKDQVKLVVNEHSDLYEKFQKAEVGDFILFNNGRTILLRRVNKENLEYSYTSFDHYMLRENFYDRIDDVADIVHYGSNNWQYLARRRLIDGY